MIWHDIAKSTLLLFALPHLSKNHCCCHLRVRLSGNGSEGDFGSQLPPGRKAETPENIASSRRRLELMPCWVFALLLVTPLEALFA